MFACCFVFSELLPVDYIILIYSILYDFLSPFVQFHVCISINGII